MEGKPSIEVPISELPVLRTATEAVVHTIVFLKRYPVTHGRLARLPSGAATAHLRRELYSAGEIRAKQEKILEKLWDIPTYELEYFTLDDGVRMLDRLAREI
jgi:hypothetical protein